MAITDNKTQYVRDNYLTTKDQCFECTQEWLECEMAIMRGRTKGDFEITLFSDLGEEESKKVHKLCNQYAVFFRNILNELKKQLKRTAKNKPLARTIKLENYVLAA